MEVLFLIIGITLSSIAVITIGKRLMLSKGFIIKRAKVIGFEGYNYLSPSIDYKTIYNTKLYPIIELEDENKVFKVAISLFENDCKLERGDEIEVIYPKGKLEKTKIYNKDSVYNFYCLTFVMGLLITVLSITII